MELRMQNEGVVRQVIGPTVDVQFHSDAVPNPYNALNIEDKEAGINLTLEVALHIGNDVCRCVAMSSTDGLVRGMKVVNTGSPITVPVGEQVLGHIFNLLGDSLDDRGKLPNPEKRLSIHRP